ncbi:hypothetical protein [Streptomyces sp. NPDC001530]|uniref:hypothetical protein n=1 Tax=Streptomyces sp. NPDC001530 TaxID=3364582 RepID=UPI00367D429B
MRRLVKRVREELGDLTDEDRAQIQQAITVTVTCSNAFTPLPTRPSRKDDLLP